VVRDRDETKTFDFQSERDRGETETFPYFHETFEIESRDRDVKTETISLVNRPILI